MKITLSLIVVSAVLAGAQAPDPADLIIHNAKIYTVNTKQPRAEAIAIRGQRIAAVGSNADILALKGSATRVIDAGGATIVPGLHDSHGHFTNFGASLQRLNLRGTTSAEQIAGMVKAAAAKARPGEWILGRSWDQNDWSDKTFPIAAVIDRAAPNNPVYLTRVDGHAGWANSKAMELAGLTKDTKDPPGGEIIRGRDGTPTGVLVDRAQGLVSGKIPDPTPEQLVDQMLLADRECRRLGLTMVHDAGTGGQNVDLYKKLIDEDKLQTRLYVMLRGSLDSLRPHFAKGPVKDYKDHRLAVRAIKIGADGALGSYGAALLEPYSDRPETKGLLTTPQEEVTSRRWKPRKPDSRPAFTRSATTGTASLWTCSSACRRRFPARGICECGTSTRRSSTPPRSRGSRSSTSSRPCRQPTQRRTCPGRRPGSARRASRKAPTCGRS